MLQRLAPLIRLGFVCSRHRIHLVENCLTGALKSPASVNRPAVLGITSRSYAKGRDIKKNKKKSDYVNENELSEFFDVEVLNADLSKPLDNFKKELVEQTSLRTTQSAIENLKITFEGNTYTIQDLAEIGRKSPKMYILDFSAFPQTLPVVMETLQKSNLNVNVQQDGTKVFVPTPRVTREHREVLVKKAKVYFIKCKESIKDIQMKYVKKLKNMERVGDDTKFRLTNQLTALGDRHINSAEAILKTKQEELLHSE